MVKKERSGIVNKTVVNEKPAQFYQTHLQTQLTRPQCIVLNLLVALIQEHKQVEREGLANAFPLGIKFKSRRRKIQRFLVLPQLTLGNIWFSLVTY